MKQKELRWRARRKGVFHRRSEGGALDLNYQDGEEGELQLDILTERSFLDLKGRLLICLFRFCCN